MLVEIGIYNGTAVASWNVERPECGARRIIGRFEALEPGQIVPLAVSPYMKKKPDLGGFVAFSFPDGARYPLSLETDAANEEACAIVGSHPRAFARVEAVSREDCPASLVEETGDWYEGAAVDVRLTLLVDEEA